MRELFNVQDMVKLAVEDERTGVAFYSAAAGKVAGAELKKILRALALQESYHQKRFEQILATLGSSQVEQYPGEFTEYLRVLTGQRAFPDEQTALQMAGDAEDDASIIDMASWFERDTLMLMHELAPLLPSKDKAVLDEIIKEEQGHLVTLAQARRALMKP